MRSAAPTSALTGTLLAGRYNLVRMVKSGGMGSVYEAEDIKLGSRVAVKVLSPEMAAKPDMVRRFFREAKAPSFAQHPNIVAYLDFDQIVDGPAYLVMEFLQGDDLERVLKRRGPLPWSELAPLMLQACRALSSAHDAGIIHRDIKPSNFVLLDHAVASEPHVKLIDFGIAKFTENSRLHSHTEVTRQLMGSDRFIAPEMYAWVPANPRTDIYALGVTMFRLLTGKYPESEGYELDPPSLLCPESAIPPAADAIVLRATHVNPYARFETIAELAAAIAATQGPQAASTPTTDLPTAPALPADIATPAPELATATLEREPTVPVPPRTPPAALRQHDPPSVTVVQPKPRLWPALLATAAVSSLLALAGFFLYLQTTTPDERVPGPAISEQPDTRPQPGLVQDVPESPQGKAETWLVRKDPSGMTSSMKVPYDLPTTETVQNDTPAAPAPAPPPLDLKAANALLLQQASAVRRCAQRDNLLKGMSVPVQVKIAADGTARVTLARLDGEAHAGCIRQHFKKNVQFPASERGGTIKHTFQI